MHSWAIHNANQEIAAPAARLGQAFATNPKHFAACNAGWYRQSNHLTTRAGYHFAPALSGALWTDPQIAP